MDEVLVDEAYADFLLVDESTQKPLLFGDGDDARAQSVRIILFALLDVVGSLMFVAGCVLYYPAYEDSCPEDWACIMIGAELFVVGSGLFMIGAGSNLYHDCWTAGGVGQIRLKPAWLRGVPLRLGDQLVDDRRDVGSQGLHGALRAFCSKRE